jgi:hypothetical protein
MPAYPTPARAIYQRLATSGPVLAVLGGGVWDRPLKRSGPGATPAAFAPTPPYAQLPAAVVVDRGEAPDGGGPGAAFLAYPIVYLYAADDPNGTGRAALEAALPLVRGELDRWAFATTAGTDVVLTPVDRLGITPDPADEGRLMDYLRVQADGLWRAEV